MKLVGNIEVYYSIIEDIRFSSAKLAEANERFKNFEFCLDFSGVPGKKLIVNLEGYEEIMSDMGNAGEELKVAIDKYRDFEFKFDLPEKVAPLNSDTDILGDPIIEICGSVSSISRK